MRTAEEAEASVRRLLDGIHDIKHLDIWMPHRFSVDEITVQPKINQFAPSSNRWSVTATVKVPVLWSVANSRAVLPAHNENVAQFRQLIEDNAPYAPARRMRIARWDVTPDDFKALPPRDEPPPDWTVRVTLDVV